MEKDRFQISTNIPLIRIIPRKDSSTSSHETPDINTADASLMHQKLRVAAYCRVSTKSEIQSGSLEMQCTYYRKYIHEHENWILAKIFKERKSGKNISNRIEFQKMLRMCRDNKIDIILTKSIKRFCRNTVDLLKTCRELKQLGVTVYFEAENIWTSDATSELLLTIYAGLAQNESENLSENIKWGIRRKIERCDSGLVSRPCFGYRKDRNGRLAIFLPEASIVKRIFRLKLSGYSLGDISNILNADNIPSPSGKSTWNKETINKILHNEKYTGNVLLGKTYIPKLLSGKQKRNCGKKTRYYMEHTHDAIISIEDFKKAGGWVPNDGAGCIDVVEQ